MRLPVADAARLLERAAEESGCPTFALRMARSRQVTNFGAISLLLTHQATRCAKRSPTTVEYRNLLNESLAMSLEEHGDLVILREELVVEPGVPTRQAYELAIGAIFGMCHALLGGRWQPHSVHFSHAGAARPLAYTEAFSARASSSAANSTASSSVRPISTAPIRPPIGYWPNMRALLSRACRRRIAARPRARSPRPSTCCCRRDVRRSSR